MKGIKTTIAAFLLLIAGLALVTGLMIGWIDTPKFTAAMSSLAAFGAVIIGFLAKDQDKSHTQK